MHIPKSIGAAFPPSLRLWALPLVTAGLILAEIFWAGMDSIHLTMIAAVAIVVAGIPHGTLDAEIAAAHFGHNNFYGKAKIVASYVGCAFVTLILWTAAPECALVLFLVVSVVHFSRDWRSGVDPFLAIMVGWALVALPALSHPQAVASIFEMLTGSHGGAMIAALLACTSVPATLGSLVFAYWAFRHDEIKSGIEVVSCVVAALFLPPLIAFGIFFCGLHSPRHMRDALNETRHISASKKMLIMTCVFALSIGLGVALVTTRENTLVNSDIIRVAFVLISTLTVPHFILEYLMSAKHVTDEQFGKPGTL